jgi:peptidoglycan/LPS O-acetylase OafA/YrhL
VITLRRVTSSQAYLPFIDGLRFYTLLSVVIIHYVDFYEARTYPIRNTGPYQQLHLDQVFGFSDNSILVFFAISGFILGLPFAKSIFAKQPYPSLGDFYLRRITRLEPPYLLVLTGLFLMNVFLIHRDTLANTLPHYLASFFYLHNIIYEYHPTLNFVFWTLEIEVQFYLMAPFLAYVFKLEKIRRRTLLVFVMLLFGVVNHYYKTPFLSLFNYFHYFLAGFLALDLFLHTSFKKSYLFDAICFILAFFMYTGIVKYGIPIAFMIALLIYFSPFSILWEKILTVKWVTITGGMCYSIYMLHQPAMAVFLNRFFGNDIVKNSLWLDFSLKLGLVLALVFIVSTTFFILVERPCMKKGWYKNLLGRKKVMIPSGETGK